MAWCLRFSFEQSCYTLQNVSECGIFPLLISRCNAIAWWSEAYRISHCTSLRWKAFEERYIRRSISVCLDKRLLTTGIQWLEPLLGNSVSSSDVDEDILCTLERLLDVLARRLTRIYISRRTEVKVLCHRMFYQPHVQHSWAALVPLNCKRREEFRNRIQDLQPSWDECRWWIKHDVHKIWVWILVNDPSWSMKIHTPFWKNTIRAAVLITCSGGNNWPSPRLWHNLPAISGLAVYISSATVCSLNM
jgi:hypothetical protein